MNKLLSVVLVFIVSFTTVWAEVFEPETKFNAWTTERFQRECWITSSEQTTQYCKIETWSELFRERLDIVNWYLDFDIIMRERVYNEILYDYGWTPQKQEYFGIEEFENQEAAYEVINDYSIAYDTFINKFLSDPMYSEDEMKDGIVSRLFVLMRELDWAVVGYKEIDLNRSFLIRDGIITNSIDYSDINLGYIDNLYSVFEDELFGEKYIMESEVETYREIYFPSVIKFLELQKEWSIFYRDNTNLSDWAKKRLGYNDKEIDKSIKWTYNNSFKTKVSFESPIKQTIGWTILDWEGPELKLTPSIDINEIKTKLEEYEELLWKDLVTEYDRLNKVLDDYFTKKKRSWMTASKVESMRKWLIISLPVVIEKYEKRQYESRTKSDVDKYANYVWILLVLEKVLEENRY